MINVHLEMAQLWRCPVKWCEVWKGSVRACLEHLSEKRGGSSLVALKNVAKFFPPWTVSCHEAGCRLVHRYRVYKDPFPHQTQRGASFLVPCPV